MRKLLLSSALFVAAVSTITAQMNEGSSLGRLGVKPISKEVLNEGMLPLQSDMVSKVNFDSPSTRAMTASYRRPEGTLLAGMRLDGSYYYPLIVGTGYSDWMFKNTSKEVEDGASYTWIYQDMPVPAAWVSENGDLTMPMDMGTFEDTPLIKIVGSSTVRYQYGSQKNVPSGVVPAARRLSAGSPGYLPLTHADVNYGGYALTIQVDDVSGYAAGPKVLDGSVKSIGTASIFRKPMSPIYVREVNTIVHSKSGKVIPEGGSFRMEVREVNSDGEITSNVLAYGKATSADVVDMDAGFFAISFKFYQEEGGVTSTYDYVLDKTCAIVVSGWENPEDYDFGFLFSQEVNDVERGGTAYNLMEDGKFYQLGSSEGVNRFNLFFQLDAIYNCLKVEPLSEIVTVPDDGGLAYFDYEGTQREFVQVYLSPFKDTRIEEALWLEKDLPDWLSLTLNDNEWAESGVVLCKITGEPLPKGNTGRTEEVVLGSYGVTAKFIVRQGPDAITSQTVSTVKAIANGENFDLTYSTEMTSVQVLNTAGQVMATYNLPDGGSFTMPASDLTSGLYMLKFVGEGTTTVKIMK